MVSIFGGCVGGFVVVVWRMCCGVVMEVSGGCVRVFGSGL